LLWQFKKSLQLVRKKAFPHVVLTWSCYPCHMAAACTCMLSHQSNKGFIFPREFQCWTLQLLHFWILLSIPYGISKWIKPSLIQYTGLPHSQKNELSILFYCIKKINKRLK
jgi:hypothetical protein